MVCDFLPACVWGMGTRGHSGNVSGGGLFLCAQCPSYVRCIARVLTDTPAFPSWEMCLGFVFKCFPNASPLPHSPQMPAACESVLEDIEDIVSAEDAKPHDRRFVRRNVFPKVRKRNSQKHLEADDEPPSDRWSLTSTLCWCFSCISCVLATFQK